MSCVEGRRLGKSSVNMFTWYGEGLWVPLNREGSGPQAGALSRTSPFLPVLYVGGGSIWNFIWRKASILQRTVSNTRSFLGAHSILL